MTFQSTHPSRGRTTGGRTGHEAIEAIQGAAAIVLAGCLYLSQLTVAESDWVIVAYAIVIAAVAGGLIEIARQVHPTVASTLPAEVRGRDGNAALAGQAVPAT